MAAYGDDDESSTGCYGGRHDLSRLLLDSRVVELTKARHPIFVILCSSKPLFFKGLNIELRGYRRLTATHVKRNMAMRGR